MKEFKVRVVRKVCEALDINSYEFAAIGGEALPSYDAGAHVDVHLPGGLVRQYSLCGHASLAGHYRIAVLRDPKTRGGSQAMHDAIQEGDVLLISAPRNLFPLIAGEGPSILLAGGIGVTPLLAMAYQLHRLGKPFELHYFARERERVAFLSELESSGFGDRVTLHLDDEVPPGEDRVRKVLTGLALTSRVYTCGPTGFLKHVLETAEAVSWPASQLHYETFAPAERQAGDTFEVRIQSTGESVVVGADETVVSAVARLGIDIPMSCEQGICGTCLTRVVQGEVDHQDFYLSDDEKQVNDQFTPCCSRAKSSLLVLDL